MLRVRPGVRAPPGQATPLGSWSCSGGVPAVSSGQRCCCGHPRVPVPALCPPAVAVWSVVESWSEATCAALSPSSPTVPGAACFLPRAVFLASQGHLQFFFFFLRLILKVFGKAESQRVRRVGGDASSVRWFVPRWPGLGQAESGSLGLCFGLPRGCWVLGCLPVSQAH